MRLAGNIKNKVTDFNCDLGQSFGVYKNEAEFELLQYVSSVNIACGFHAGDPLTIKKALLACKDQNVSIGAHIGFPDISGFGYRNLELTDEEIEAIVVYQVGAIASFAKTFGLEIEHVRPHGAMYKKAAENFQFSLAIARAIKKYDEWLIYFGAAGQSLQNVSEELNIRVAHEVFLDKKYNFDGAVLLDKEDIISTPDSMKRLNSLINYNSLDNINGGKTELYFDTVHFSSKAINSLELLQEATKIVTPLSVNYNQVEDSGWTK